MEAPPKQMLAVPVSGTSLARTAAVLLALSAATPSRTRAVSPDAIALGNRSGEGSKSSCYLEFPNRADWPIIGIAPIQQNKEVLNEKNGA